MSESVPTSPRVTTRSQSAIGKAIDRDQHSTSATLSEQPFMRMLCVERKRTERSSRRFVLMLLDSGSPLPSGRTGPVLESALQALSHSVRETDLKGWYKDGSILGVIFTEIGSAEGANVVALLSTRVTDVLSGALTIEQVNAITVSFHVYPDDSLAHGPRGPSDLPLYPDLGAELNEKRASRFLKRSMDVAGSLLALILSVPLLLAISIVIKLTSKGPLVFRQERLGLRGRRFTFLKFRSMYVETDSTIHKEYAKRVISGAANSGQAAGGRIAVGLRVVQPSQHHRIVPGVRARPHLLSRGAEWHRRSVTPAGEPSIGVCRGADTDPSHLLLTFSRSSQIVAALSLLPLLLAARRPRLAYALPAVAVAGVLVGVAAVPEFQRYLRLGVSLRGRPSVFRDVLSQASERPLFGFGLLNVEFRTLTRVQNPHNAYLAQFAYFGIMGLALFLMLLVAFGRLVLQNVRSAREPSTRLIVALVAAVLLQGVVRFHPDVPGVLRELHVLDLSRSCGAWTAQVTGGRAVHDALQHPAQQPGWLMDNVRSESGSADRATGTR